MISHDISYFQKSSSAAPAPMPLFSWPFAGRLGHPDAAAIATRLLGLKPAEKADRMVSWKIQFLQREFTLEKSPRLMGKSPFLMGKSTISMAIFNSFLYVYQAGYQENGEVS